MLPSMPALIAPSGPEWRRRLAGALAVSAVLHGLIVFSLKPGPGPNRASAIGSRLTAQLLLPGEASGHAALTADSQASASMPAKPVPDEAQGGAATSSPRASASGTLPLDLLHSREYYLASRVHRAPTLLRRAEFAYPEGARAKEGVVFARVLINEQGSVDGVVVETSSPSGVFDAATIEALMNWRFTAGILHGRPVPTQIAMEVRFSASDEIPPMFAVLGKDR